MQRKRSRLNGLVLAILGIAALSSTFVAIHCYREASRLRESITVLKTDLQESLSALERIFSLFEADGLTDKGQLSKRELAQIQVGLEFYNRFVMRQYNQRSLRVLTARASRQLAALYETMERTTDEETALKLTIALYDQHFAGEPPQADSRFALAEALNRLGELLFATGRPVQAETEQRRVVLLMELLAKEFPGDRRNQSQLAEAYGNLAAIQATLDRSAAEANFRRSIRQLTRLMHDFADEPQYAVRSYDAHQSLVMLLTRSGRIQEAEDALQAYIDIVATASERAAEPHLLTYMHALARSDLAAFWWSRGRQRDALLAYSESRGSLERLTANVPSFLYLDRLARVNISLGQLLTEMGDDKEADRAFHQSSYILDGIQRTSSNRVPLARLMNRLGAGLRISGRPQQAENVLLLLSDLCGDESNWPKTFEATAIYRDCLCNQAQVAHDGGKPERARRFLAEAVKQQEALLKIDTPDTLELVSIGAGWKLIGENLYRLGDWEASINALDKSMQLRKHDDSAAWFMLAVAHGKLHRKREARRCYERAVRSMRQHDTSNAALNRLRDEAAQMLEMSANSIR
ncbi:MAG: hypothetical protein O7D91_06095 [Planctomycetota bacterium]|nr:hypothetical protein [Planctomycetota bacterium]